MTKTCSCGAGFLLHVELAVHRQKTGHPAFNLVESVAPSARPLPPKARSLSWKKPVLAGMTVLSLLGLSAGVNLTVRTYTSWQCTADVLLLP